MRVSDLTGALLDYWTARAEGVPADQLEIRDAQRPDDPHAPKQFCVRVEWDNAGFGGRMARRLDYSTNWAAGGPLVEKHMLELENLVDPVRWSARFWNGSRLLDEYGPTPLIAICRAVVRAAFGDEVEDLPC